MIWYQIVALVYLISIIPESRAQSNCGSGQWVSSFGCQQCNSGYQLIWQSSIYQCQSCGGVCLSCTTNNYYNITQTSCQQCNNVLCLSCTNQQYCLNCVSGGVLNSNICECDDGYYQDTNQCLACTTPCVRCESPTFCTMCEPKMFLDAISGQCKCFAGNYYELSASPPCLPCTEPCFSCTSATSCVSCSDSSMSLIVDQCFCPSGSYDLSGTCFPCSSPCQTCTGSATYCDTCRSGYGTADGMGGCQCSSSQYLSQTGCVPCPAICTDCINASVCTACIAGSYRDTPANGCVCISGYYLDATDTCQPCPLSQCDLQCTNAISCSVCNSISDSVENQCLCLNGYYYDLLATPNSQSCVLPCANCISITLCTSCADTSLTVNSRCRCDISTYYDSGSSMCLPCNSLCHGCIGPNIGDCTGCSSIGGSGPSCTCGVGYYPLADGTCDQCAAVCGGCNHQTTCTTCPIMNQIGADCSCAPGYYLASSMYCLLCIAPCVTCINTNSQCLTCADPNSLPDPISGCNCNVHYYLDNNNTCQLCMSTCVTCATSSTCTSCTSAFDAHGYLSTKTGLCKCDWYYYLTPDESTCAHCVAPCSRCTSISKCTTCVDPHMYISGTNTCLCGTGYANAIANVCYKCLYPCKKCSLNVNYCTQCQFTNYNLNHGSCTCPLGFDTPTYGPCVCPQGYFDNLNKQCVNCQSSGCAICSGVGTCTICMSNYILTNNKCICAIGYFSQNNSCQLCDSKCFTCMHMMDNCTSCPPQYSLIQGTCLCKVGLSLNNCGCDIGYYQFDNICQQCQIGCLNCTSHSCFQCDINFILINGQCICPFGFTESNRQCIKCQTPCFSCQTYSDYCTSCNDSALTASIGICFCLSHTQLRLYQQNICQCEQGYYAIDSGCSQCIQNCLQCDSKQCNTCSPNYQLINSQCVCVNGYYEQGLQCLSCIRPCLTCVSQMTCSSCIVNYVFDNGQCQCNSPDYILDNLDCIACNSDDGKILEACNYASCTDGVWTWGDLCDDGNSISNDGCTNCQIDIGYGCNNTLMKPSECFQCSLGCNLCNLDECSDCQLEYYLLTGFCKNCPQECQTCDPNGCITCKYDLPFKTDVCHLCTDYSGLYLQENNICTSICGDGVTIQSAEQCDDGNLIENDGCSSSCTIEYGWSCIGLTCSQLVQITPSIIEVQTSIYSNVRQFILSFNPGIHLSTLFISNIQIVDYMYHSTLINYTTNFVIQSVSSNQSYDRIFINITLIDSSLGNYLWLYINQSDQNFIINPSNLTYPITDYQALTQAQILATQESIQVTQWMLYVILGAVFLGLLIGGLSMFYELLDILQLFSFLQYINTNLSYVVNQLINSFQFAQLQFLSRYINLLNYLPLSMQTNLASPYKIQQDGFSPLIIANISNLFNVYVTLAFVYIISKYVLVFIQQISIHFHENDGRMMVKWKLLIMILKEYTIQLCKQATNSLVYSGLLRTHMSIGYDYCFFVMLNIHIMSLNFDDMFLFSNTLASLMLLAIYIMIIIISTNRFSLYIKERDKRILSRIYALVQDLKLDGYMIYYQVFLLTKKFFFMVFLVLLYDEPLFQISCIMYLQVIQILILLTLNPFEEIAEGRKQFICEFLTLIIEVTFYALVLDDEILYFTIDQRDLIGWITISFMLMILAVQVIFSVYQQCKLINEIFHKFKDLYFHSGPKDKLNCIK